TVNNDQKGLFLELPRKAPAGDTRRTYCGYAATNVYGMIVPLPDNVFLRPETAEIFAWEFATHQAENWQKQHYKGDPVHPQLDETSVAARTFLMRGHEYLFWLADQNIHKDVLKLASLVPFPAHVWVTEFYRRLPANDVDLSTVIAHVVMDATASNRI